VINGCQKLVQTGPLTQDIVNAQLLNVRALPLRHPVIRGVVLVIIAATASECLDVRLRKIHLHIEHEGVQLGSLELVEDGGVVGDLVERLGLG
jgi:hypothetical protein